MTLELSDRNIAVVNSLRSAAQKASIDFNIVKFFADVDYAQSSLARFASSGNSALAALADKASDSLLRPALPMPRFDVTLPLGPPGTQPTRSPAPASSALRYTAAKELMNGLAVDAAGLRSVLFVLQLERTTTLADLAALLPRFEKLVGKRVGPVAAQAMAAQMRNVL
jgi:hypothetical protein